MKIIVTHSLPDIDAISSAWILKRFLPGWDEAEIKFVPAGNRYKDKKAVPDSDFENTIEMYGEDEVIHVDTGMGPLDHHQTPDENVCGATRALDFALIHNKKELKDEKLEAVRRIVGVVVDIDHFKELYRPDPLAYYHDFSLVNILDGLKLQKPDSDQFYTDFIFQALDALVHEFENRIWAEKEIKEIGIKFESKWGEGLGVETVNDDVIKLGQMMGASVVVRRDPRKGYVRIKANPKSDTDLTQTYEQLKKMDPEATWFLHVSRKMLLNGTTKNPTMRPTKLKLDDIIAVLKK
ncbi:MAG: hypothetical protein A3A51_02695 [Candidatus Levybacteria bacterium RIFCSPLOWO2_01_FULL_39_10]|nr:MAG: hypothetical protein A3A51_02695 [Candidatus Levybacteria bacterium RIFCSPLOWO2_01_FULL_39_10]